MKQDNGFVKKALNMVQRPVVQDDVAGWIFLSSKMMNGLTDIVLTKIDVLSGLDKLYVCTGYEIDGKVYDYIPSDQSIVAKAKPIYKEFNGWKEDISKMESFDELPENCKAYIRFIEEFTGVRMSMVSVGPDRVNNIYIHEI